MTDKQSVVKQALTEMDRNKRSSMSKLPLWLATVIGVLLTLNILPFLAPVFMKLGLESLSRAIYFIYQGLCHQMAQRSFFLFGPEGFQMYNLSQLPVKAVGLNTAEQMLVLRQYVGGESIGWKVAWSDRMVYMYTTPLLIAVAYVWLRRQRDVHPLSLLAFVLLLLPMAIDGGTHWLSDLAGIGQGFRYTNEWLAVLTNHAFPPSFYAGDAFGSFNSLMRLLSGVTFGIAVGGLMFPYIDQAARPPRSEEAIVDEHSK